MKMEENYKFLKLIANIHNVDLVILSSGIIDFYKPTKKIKYNLVNKFLKDENIPIYKELNIKYLISESISFHNKRKSTTDYSSLKYDKSGAVSLVNKNFKIDSIRWEGNTIRETKLNYNQYKYFDSISQFCAKRKIKLFLAQSPYREGYRSKLNKKEQTILKNHKDRIKLKLLEKNQTFIDVTDDNNWNDSLFVDYSHLNKKGAKIFTRLVVDQINSSTQSP